MCEYAVFLNESSYQLLVSGEFAKRRKQLVSHLNARNMIDKHITSEKDSTFFAVNDILNWNQLFRSVCPLFE